MEIPKKTVDRPDTSKSFLLCQRDNRLTYKDNDLQNKRIQKHLENKQKL